MTKNEFEKQYNPHTRCYITYRNILGDKLGGLLLDGIQTSTNGTLFCYVENFYNRVPLKDIESIRDTGISWVK